MPSVHRSTPQTTFPKDKQTKGSRERGREREKRESEETEKEREGANRLFEREGNWQGRTKKKKLDLGSSGAGRDGDFFFLSGSLIP